MNEKDNINTKKKMLSLFNEVMTDKDFNFYSFQGSSQNTCSVFSEGNHYSYRNENDFEDMNGYGVNSTGLDRGEYLYGETRRVIIKFNELPDLCIEGSTKPAEKSKSVIELPKKGLLGLLGFKNKIYHIRHHLVDVGDSMIKFGPLEHKISKKQFQDMFTKAQNEFDRRELANAQEKLDERLDKYKEK